MAAARAADVSMASESGIVGWPSGESRLVPFARRSQIRGSRC